MQYLSHNDLKVSDFASPRRVRIFALVAFFVLLVIWLTPSFSTLDSLTFTKPVHKDGAQHAESVAEAVYTGSFFRPPPLPTTTDSPARTKTVHDSEPSSSLSSPNSASGGTPSSVPDSNHDNNNATSTENSTAIIGSKVAVILEDRPLPELTPIIMHFHSVLGPTWPIVLFTSHTSNLSTSAPFQRAIEDARIMIKYIPASIQLKTSHSVSAFLTKPWFWDQLAPATHVLIFQADSILCANSPQHVDDYLEYDLVGAPIGKFWGEGFNGGLSLRDRSMILDILATSDWSVEKETYTKKLESYHAELIANGTGLPEGNGIPGVVAVDMEDQWFYQKMKARGAKFPSEEVASRFAVETIYAEEPLGYHQVQRYYGDQKDRMAHIDRWCPEHRMCTGDFIYLHPEGGEEKKEEGKVKVEETKKEEGLEEMTDEEKWKLEQEVEAKKWKEGHGEAKETSS
jgi:hypothetical protein